MKMAPSSKDKAAAVAAAAAARPAQEAMQKCPRCDSANTKFCYYNNYSLSQPRHFCKTCRRYWTKGGALRNVPVGGGCRKNKRSRNSAASSSGTSSSTKDTDIGALKFFQSFTPAMDFNLAGLNNPPKPFGSAFLDISSSGGSGLSFPFPPLMNKLPAENLQMGPPPPQLPSLASSIESLSYINQDLHWKLQQQRLTLLFGAAATPTAAADQNQIVPFSGNHHHHQEKPSPQPLMFHNLEIGADHDGPKPNDDHQHHHILGDHNHQIQNDDDSILNSRTEWFFDSCYAPVNPNPATNVNNPNPNDGNSINWNGMPAWSPYSGI